MSELALAIAQEARRSGLLGVLWQRRAALTLDQLEALLRSSTYGEDLGRLKLSDLFKLSVSQLPGESAEAAMMRVFRARPDKWLTSRIFIRDMGLRRWVAQRLLSELAERGLLIREGERSTTRYRLAAQIAQDA